MKAGRDILGGFGPDKTMHQAARASKGGVMPGDKKDLSYSPPQGPKGIMQSGPGLHGSNSGNTHQPNAKSSSGGPGIGGENRCSQGRH